MTAAPDLVRDDAGRVCTVPCPRCGQTVALRLAVLEPAEARAYLEGAAMTSDVVIDRGAVGPPGGDYDHMARAIAWVQHVVCGYDGHYTFGGP